MIQAQDERRLKEEAQAAQCIAGAVKDFTGPCRQTATSMIEEEIWRCERKLTGLRILREVSMGLPPEAEPVMWEMMSNGLRGIR